MMKAFKALPLLALLILVGVGLSGCRESVVPRTAPLPQRGYLWQRSWTPAVAQAFAEADTKMEGVVVLGAEVEWREGAPRVIRSSIRWEALRATKKPCSLALRIAPFPGPFHEDDLPARTIAATAQSLLAEAGRNGVPIREFQLDFDCAEKKLPGYRTWIRAIRREAAPPRLVITTLPSWLKESEFRNLIGDVDGYVLQVHSVPTRKESGRFSLCDAALARKWVDQAARLGVPFSVALPTYRCLAGYDEEGKLRGIMMDGVPPAWPAGTHVLEFGTNADEIAELVSAWQRTAPAALREILWYRLPVAADRFNWQWKTLSAVMAGRKPERRWAVLQKGANPVDLALSNVGESEELPPEAVAVAWDRGTLVAEDALAGWTLRTDSGSVLFTPAPGFRPRVPPDGEVSLGWLRFDGPAVLRTNIVNHEKPLP